MKRLAGVIVVAACATAAFATWGGAAPARDSGSAKADATRLPRLPADVRQRGRWRIGVKCDAPPFGYIDVRGRNAGFDVEIAKWFSRFAFGRENRVSYVCAPTPAREPLLTTERVDLVISTFTYTQDRDTRIDFSRAYYKATGRLLVPNETSIRSLRDLSGKTVATTTGSIYDRWMRRCFPQTTPLVTDSFANAVLSFRQGRADAVMWDDTAVLGIATQDAQLKLTNDQFLEGPYGVGIKQGNVAMKRWVDSRLELMRRKDRFMTILRSNIPARLLPAFSRNILRPNNRFGYARVNPVTVCP